MSKRKIQIDRKPRKKKKTLQDIGPSNEFEADTAKAEDIYQTDGVLQRVYPYQHRFTAYAKGRWLGRSILEVYQKEFRHRPAEYFAQAIQKGDIQVNQQTVSADYVIQNQDIVTHMHHQHEPPVSSQPIRIVHEDEEVLMVDKPASIPVHPTGRYNYNTVVMILEKQRGDKLYPANRLDRLTSGLLLFGKNKESAKRLAEDMQEHRIQKEYVCKVRGLFPDTAVCDQPIKVVAHKLGLNCVDKANGKPSLTEFKRLSVVDDGQYSIVYCKPKTGRTHQIRVHLQYLGYPIANDPLYCNEEVWGEDLGKEEATTEFDPLIKKMEEWRQRQENSYKELVAVLGKDCEVCGTPRLPDPTEDQLCIWLHAWRYRGPEWSYTTVLPEWVDKESFILE